MERVKYINLYTDFGFEKLFGTEANKEVLCNFLDDLINDKGRIVNLKYITREEFGISEPARETVFNFHCETDRNEEFLVEMQRSQQKYFKDRSIYYATFPIREQEKRALSWGTALKVVYYVDILGFVFDGSTDDDDYLHEVKLMDDRGNIFFNKLTFFYVEMPKFNKSESELETNLDKWLYLFKHLSEFESRPTTFEDPKFDRLFEIAEIANLTEEERSAYKNGSKKKKPKE